MRRLLSASLLVLTAACGGDADDDDPRESPGSKAREEAAEHSWDPSTITPQMVALGDSLFHGLIGATSCQACHGADGAQAVVAPNLTDSEWLHSDGSWEGIHTTIKSGVMSPKQFSSIMPPFGGAPLTIGQSRAVAAYVYKLSHK
jgi:mono/diheme cytochrome c family protein